MNADSLNYVQADNLVTRKIAGETIIVPIGNNAGELSAIYTLNPTGTKIWEMLGAAAADPLIVQSICEEYDVTLEEARKDLEEFQASLHSAGLLRFSPQSRG
jgi:hypothetical protein